MATKHRRPEVDHRGPPGARKAHVRRLEVAVDEAELMQRSQGGADLREKGHQPFASLGFARGGEPFRRVAAGDEVFDEKRRAGDLVDREIMCANEARKAAAREQRKLTGDPAGGSRRRRSLGAPVDLGYQLPRRILAIDDPKDGPLSALAEDHARLVTRMRKHETA